MPTDCSHLIANTRQLLNVDVRSEPYPLRWDEMDNRPPPSSPAVSHRFSSQKTRDTKPELQLRRQLWSRGVRYRVSYPAPGRTRRTIDVATPTKKLPIFIDGCFWYGCPAHLQITSTNRDWWAERIAANRQRDRDTDSHRADLDWTVIRIWEHEDIDNRAAEIAATIPS